MILKDISFRPEEIGNADDIIELISKKAKCPRDKFEIKRFFIDSRHKNNVKVVYRIGPVSLFNEEDLYFNAKRRTTRPVIVGLGPAGMFAGLILAHSGLEPIIIEQGKCVDERMNDISKARDDGKLINKSSNIQFGEGGAGTFSDGKLNTGVSSPFITYINKVFIRHGSPYDIMYDSHPHIGTDYLRVVVKGIREEIKAHGGEILFNTRLDNIIISDNKVVGIETNNGVINTDTLFLGVGNSSRQVFSMLQRNKVTMENKPFSIGLRIEHRREDIDKARYGFDTSIYKNISAANYKLAETTSTGRKLYTFCMCPGGEVINASSYPEGIVTNGMSYRARDGINSNSAILVPVTEAEYGFNLGDGIAFQEKLERRAFLDAGADGSCPVIRFEDFKMRKASSHIGRIKPTISNRLSYISFDLLPPFIYETISEGVDLMARRIEGFNDPDSILSAVETRSSSPIRILRDKDSRQSVNVSGLYPIGEGAGYSGGIMSSAIDGIKSATSFIESVIN